MEAVSSHTDTHHTHIPSQPPTMATTTIALATLPKVDNQTLAGEFNPSLMRASSRASREHTAPVDAETPRDSMGREAGEQDPLLLRGRIIGEGELDELRKWVLGRL